uniref:Uncharacterized protein n=1 Tax=Arundo donax TaxID=35708 RepID=A0A0A8XR19_ARUDO
MVQTNIDTTKSWFMMCVTGKSYLCDTQETIETPHKHESKGQKGSADILTLCKSTGQL